MLAPALELIVPRVSIAGGKGDIATLTRLEIVYRIGADTMEPVMIYI